MNTPITTPGPPGDDDALEEPWRRRSDENNLWYQRFTAYLSAGPMRTKLGTYHAEGDQEGPKGTNKSKSLPRSWRDAAKRFDWKARAEAFDAWRRKEIFSEGIAVDSERVKKLVELGTKMYEKLMDNFDDLAINDKYVGQLLAVFDLIARHTGGLTSRVEHVGKGGGKIEIDETQTKLNVFWYMPQIDELPDNSVTVEEIDNPPDTAKDNENA